MTKESLWFENPLEPEGSGQWFDAKLKNKELLTRVKQVRYSALRPEEKHSIRLLVASMLREATRRYLKTLEECERDYRRRANVEFLESKSLHLINAAALMIAGEMTENFVNEMVSHAARTYYATRDSWLSTTKEPVKNQKRAGRHNDPWWAEGYERNLFAFYNKWAAEDVTEFAMFYKWAAENKWEVIDNSTGIDHSYIRIDDNNKIMFYQFRNRLRKHKYNLQKELKIIESERWLDELTYGNSKNFTE